MIASSSCGKSKKLNGESTDLAPIFTDKYEEGTLELPTHQKGEQPEESETESVTAEVTSDAPNDEMQETEAETEAAPKPSLRFISYGNGTCAVSGIGSCTDLFVVIPDRSPDGDIVTAIEDKAFYGNKEIKAVEIPSTVSHIGHMAFGECSALVYISVDITNKSFTDISGVLYSKDGTQLLAYPAASGTAELSISVSVTQIADMAFYGCDTLEIIRYDGTLSDWGKIDIGDMNYGLFTASVVCGSGK